MYVHSRTFPTLHPDEAKTFLPQNSLLSSKDMTTVELLSDVRPMELSDPKDRIYTFMALPTLDGTMSALEPDYTDQTSYLDVYRDFAVRVLKQTLDLQLLGFVEHDDDSLNDPGLSSWVPRWERGAGVEAISKQKCQKICPDSQSLQILEGGSVLCVRAVIFDQVVHVSETVQYTATTSETINTVVSLWTGAAEALVSHPNSHSSHRTLLFIWSICQGMYSGTWEEMLASVQALARCLPSDQRSQTTEITMNDEDLERVARIVRLTTHMRRFILLRRGYFGIAPCVAHVDDVCAIIFGARTPMVLRKLPGSNNAYKVVGPAWIHSKYDDVDGYPDRLGEDEDCYDWKDLGLSSEDILLH